MAKELGIRANIVESVDTVNSSQKLILFKKLHDYFDGDLQGKVFTLWGLAFKPNTDDMREAPSRVLIEKLVESGATINAYDPQASEEARRLYPGENELKIFSSANEALEQSSGLVVITEWNEFRSPDFEFIKDKLIKPLILDGRNLYDPITLTEMGFSYFGIGRGK